MICCFVCILRKKLPHKEFSSGNGTEWSQIRSVIIRGITKSMDRAAGFRFVCHKYDYRPNWTTRSLITNYGITERKSQYFFDFLKILSISGFFFFTFRDKKQKVI